MRVLSGNVGSFGVPNRIRVAGVVCLPTVEKGALLLAQGGLPPEAVCLRRPVVFAACVLLLRRGLFCSHGSPLLSIFYF